MAKKEVSLDKNLSHTVRESIFLADMLKLKIEEYNITVNVSHFVATVSGVILTISLAKMTTVAFMGENPLVKFGVVSIVAASLVTMILLLFTVEPAFKKDRDTNTFDYGTKLAELSTTQYIETIMKNLERKDNMINSYGHELHKLDKVILHRFKMIKSAISMFILGLFLGGMSIIISTLI
jgi:hypothetical protein